MSCRPKLASELNLFHHFFIRPSATWICDTRRDLKELFSLSQQSSMSQSEQENESSLLLKSQSFVPGPGEDESVKGEIKGSFHAITRIV